MHTFHTHLLVVTTSLQLEPANMVFIQTPRWRSHIFRVRSWLPVTCNDIQWQHIERFKKIISHVHQLLITNQFTAVICQKSSSQYFAGVSFQCVLMRGRGRREEGARERERKEREGGERWRGRGMREEGRYYYWESGPTSRETNQCSLSPG